MATRSVFRTDAGITISVTEPNRNAALPMVVSRLPSAKVTEVSE